MVILFFLSSNLMAPPEDRYDTEFYLRRIVSTLSLDIREYWTYRNITKVSYMIDSIAEEQNIPPLHLLALIKIESDFDPKMVYRNYNGTFDYGLTQQNSNYVQERCNNIFERSCEIYELFNPLISLLLMKERFKECDIFSGEVKIVCYNSTWKATHYNPNDPYLRRWRFELYQIKKLANGDE